MLLLSMLYYGSWSQYVGKCWCLTKVLRFPSVFPCLILQLICSLTKNLASVQLWCHKPGQLVANKGNPHVQKSLEQQAAHNQLINAKMSKFTPHHSPPQKYIYIYMEPKCWKSVMYAVFWVSGFCEVLYARGNILTSVIISVSRWKPEAKSPSGSMKWMNSPNMSWSLHTHRRGKLARQRVATAMQERHTTQADG